MKQCKRMAVLLLCLLVLAGGAQATMFIGNDATLNRQISRNTAKTLDHMPEKARARTDSLIVGVSDLLGETNPFWAATYGDNLLASLQFDELLFANNDGDMGTGVASYTLSADQTTFSFAIQKNVAYADGTPVTSDDFINALYLLLTPGYDGVYDIARAGILGVEAYLRGDADHIVGISRQDAYTFHVTLARANPQHIAYLAVPALRVSVYGDLQRPRSMTDAALFDDFYAQALARVREADDSRAAYGQYLLQTLAPGEEAVLTRHDAYWRGTPYIGTLALQVVPLGEELAAILEGDVDIISVLGSVEAVDAVVDFETGFINLYTWEGDIMGYLGMDLDNPLFADTGVRQALAVGFDREAARQARIERYGRVQDVILFDSFSVEGSEMLRGAFAYDPDRAAELLDAAGWTLAEDGLRYRDGEPFAFTLTYNTPNPVMDVVVGQMQQDYARLGIQMTLETVSFEALQARMDAGTYEMYFQARRLSAFPALAADLYVGGGRLNASGFSTDVTDRLLEMADASGDAARQTVLYELLFQEIALDMPFIPLYRRNEMLLVNARVMNMTITTSHDMLADAYRLFLTDTLENQW